MSWAVSAALLGTAIDYALDNLALVETGALGRPTPCAGWSLETLLRHLGTSVRTIGELLTGEECRSAAGADPVAALRSAADGVLGVLTHVEPPAVHVLPLAVETVACTGAFEIAVHGWDITQSTRTGLSMPSGLAQALLVLAPCLIADTDRPGLFAQPVAAPRDAGPTDTLVAFTGRGCTSQAD
jgi:uncharacterized protein (TIGR03086 family)